MNEMELDLLTLRIKEAYKQANLSKSNVSRLLSRIDRRISHAEKHGHVPRTMLRERKIILNRLRNDYVF